MNFDAFIQRLLAQPRKSTVKSASCEWSKFQVAEQQDWKQPLLESKKLEASVRYTEQVLPAAAQTMAKIDDEHSFWRRLPAAAPLPGDRGWFLVAMCSLAAGGAIVANAGTILALLRVSMPLLAEREIKHALRVLHKSGAKYPPGSILDGNLRSALSENQQARIFVIFELAIYGMSIVGDGLGIGLALVKELTELHGGRIAFRKSAPCESSTLEVRFPLAD